jgi:hypothetical protein
MRELNALPLTIGIICLFCGYFPWLTRHDAVQVRTAQNIMTAVAGWALTAMGYIGLQLTGMAARRPMWPPPPRRGDA